MGNKIFTRYNQFEDMFGVDLKNYSQNNVSLGNKGDYNKLLNEIRNLLETKTVKTTKPILEIMSSLGVNTSKPGLVQVLVGLGLMKKLGGGNYVFNVNRIDTKLSEFIFSYNHYKQIVLNNDDKDLMLPIKHLFGKFEELITGRNTFQIKNTINNDSLDNLENQTSIISLSFGDAVQALKDGKKLQRKGWNGKGMYLSLVEIRNCKVDKSVLNDNDNNKMIELLPWIGMKTADNHFVPWLASQTDVLSEDWEILE
jgi:arginine repressor